MLRARLPEFESDTERLRPTAALSRAARTESSEMTQLKPRDTQNLQGIWPEHRVLRADGHKTQNRSASRPHGALETLTMTCVACCKRFGIQQVHDTGQKGHHFTSRAVGQLRPDNGGTKQLTSKSAIRFSVWPFDWGIRRSRWIVSCSCACLVRRHVVVPPSSKVESRQLRYSRPEPSNRLQG